MCEGRNSAWEWDEGEKLWRVKEGKAKVRRM